ncbi:MAG: hypothetical protein AOA65_1841 [Candidatus Bathyarchaeota archaeon BA1]|nr:MAG: hypothetical protein AOA65_1841 [Candidatus Bathyarchaeota archaeon BA1]
MGAYSHGLMVLARRAKKRLVLERGDLRLKELILEL